MGNSLNIALTDELRAFVDRECGEGTDFATPTEYVRALLREKKNRTEAASLRAAIIEGYQDLIDGRYMEFSGNLEADIDAFEKRQKAQRGKK